MDDVPTLNLLDEDGQPVLCYVERSLNAKGKEYVLLRPVDAPVEIFAWVGDEEEEEDEMLLDVDDAELDEIMPTAKAVLAEQDLTLHRTALSLIASGNLPEFSEEDVITLDIEGDEGQVNMEQFQQLASFFHEEQEYVVCTPLDPFLFIARLNAAGQPELLTPDELVALQQLDEFKEMQLELEQLADEFDDEELN
ncbi:DUF3727 domain-containing protein [Leptolyngbya sp. FACHB-711]|uniref:DUF3727 domain-containing protein n=1 Tax=unclassified Leptolyngbya TaxID=2650499 RepID=UPI00168656B1|nr:DUF3727 domain-containing protein [Leptolyngbya sp. FACHB-711]MBD1849714.1 DUF3727 domain-containing protein [Cyanobacteria bacterium FACHB-502]MBD2023489.1 DUF3727 domain-containing protein [Leptolyngbya sp. FACHB-711]